MGEGMGIAVSSLPLPHLPLDALPTPALSPIWSRTGPLRLASARLLPTAHLGATMSQRPTKRAVG